MKYAVTGAGAAYSRWRAILFHAISFKASPMSDKFTLLKYTFKCVVRISRKETYARSMMLGGRPIAEDGGGRAISLYLREGENA